MPLRGKSKKLRLQQWLAERNVEFVDVSNLHEIVLALSPISQTYLRRLLLESRVPLSILVEGVNQASMVDLERTLVALSQEYESRDAFGRKSCRNLVITGKDHAQLAALKMESGERRAEKEEMVLWMRTWLENPALFPSWVALRMRTTQSRSTEP